MPRSAFTGASTRLACRVSAAARMKLAMNGSKPLAIDVRILLRCANVGMAEQFLHSAQIGTAGQ